MEIEAETAVQAEVEASKRPGVISVFGNSATRSDQLASVVKTVGVEE